MFRYFYVCVCMCEFVLQIIKKNRTLGSITAKASLILSNVIFIVHIK